MLSETKPRPVEAVRKPVEAVRKPVEAVRKPVEAVRKPVEAVRKPVASILIFLLFGIPITLAGVASFVYFFIKGAEVNPFKIISSTQAELADEKYLFNNDSLLFFFLGGILILVGVGLLTSIGTEGPYIPAIGVALMFLIMSSFCANMAIRMNYAEEKYAESSAWVLSQLSITEDYVPESSNLVIKPGAPGKLGEPTGITLKDGSVVTYRVNTEEGTNYLTVEQISRTDGALTN